LISCVAHTVSQSIMISLFRLQLGSTKGVMHAFVDSRDSFMEWL